MVAQSKIPKLSSAAKRAKKALDALPEGRRFDFYKRHRVAMQELEERWMFSDNRELLLELVNMRDDGWPRFYRRWALSPREAATWMQLRDELRQMWERKVSDQEASATLLLWFVAEVKRFPEQYAVFPWVPDVRTGRLMTMHRALRARLVMGVLADYVKMRKCAHPDCPAPYFLAKRKTQRICEQGECTRWAQNQYALRWWRENKQGKTASGAGHKKARKGRSKHGTRKAR